LEGDAMTWSFPRCLPAGRLLTLTCLLLTAPLRAATNDAAVATTNAEPDVIGNLRVFDVRPRVFEYLFTGAGTGPNSNAAPLLYFRDLAGNTPTARIADPLGPYTVTRFTPRKVRVFKTSVNTNLDTDASTVTLRDAAGSNRVLTVNQPLPEPGWMACLVSLSSGGWEYVRSGDTLPIEDMAVTVGEVNPTSTTIRANAHEFAIPPIMIAERKSVLALWETMRQEAEAQQARALALAEEKRQQATAAAASTAEAAVVVHPPPPPPISVASMPAYNYGYESYYPTQFEVVPYTCIWPDGQIFAQQIRVPACFVHHHGGNGHWRH
jgi:hypothetical protein